MPCASLTGRVAIANAKLAYQRYQELFRGRRWQALAARGAQTQRLLWASTGMKNPSYRDVVYVEELIGPDTVNTIPPATFEAFRDHGRPRASLTEDVDAARDTMDGLAQAGISMRDVTDRLLAEGVQLFADAFAKLLKAVEKQSKEAGAGKVNRLTYRLPDSMATAVNRSLAEWRAQGKVRRLWARDASLWTGKDEAQWLGWLGVTNDQLAHIERLTCLTEMARRRRPVPRPPVGHGGIEPRARSDEDDVREDQRVSRSSTCSIRPIRPRCKTFENKVDLKNTLFIVSSKSGSTLEPNIFKQYFFDRVAQLVGAEEAGPASSPSPIPARRCSRSPKATASDTSSSGGPTSVGATRCSRISAWFRRPSWAWTWRSSWIGPRRWSTRACRRFRSKRIPASCSAPSSASPRADSGATR